jgi:hypothetical protein
MDGGRGEAGARSPAATPIRAREGRPSPTLLSPAPVAVYQAASGARERGRAELLLCGRAAARRSSLGIVFIAAEGGLVVLVLLDDGPHFDIF